MSTPTAQIGVIGGSGFYRFLSDARDLAVSTPFGEPSDPLAVGEVAGRTVAFLARHGREHRLAPHQVNYRGNLWALRALGVRQVIAPYAVGSLRADLGPGSLVVPDQVIDRTWGREHTVYDQPGAVVHVSLADPYCPRGRTAVLRAAAGSGAAITDGGTLMVINGPRFSTRAESRWHRASGATLVGMTGMPEAAIARELAMCYTPIALVTDLDAGVDDGHGVTQHEVMSAFADHVERLKTLVAHAVTSLPTDEDCACRRSLDGLRLPFDLP